jgi:hypothetical protein
LGYFKPGPRFETVGFLLFLEGLRLAKMPLGEEVDARYDPQREELRVADYF